MSDKEQNDSHLEWSAWRIWCHPRRALYAIDDQKIMEGNLNRELAEALESLKQQKEETEKFSSQVQLLTGKLEAMRQEKAQLRLELDEARQTLREQEEVAQMIEEFDKSLTRAEGMKRDYERRIADLESRLSDAREKLSRITNNELLEPGEAIEDLMSDGRKRHLFDGDYSGVQQEPADSPREKNRAADDDWFTFLSEGS